MVNPGFDMVTISNTELMFVLKIIQWISIVFFRFKIFGILNVNIFFFYLKIRESRLFNFSNITCEIDTLKKNYK